MATLKDVAQLAGVTVTTVSRMLNGRANVSEKTQWKIRQAMEALDYYPNEMARSLKTVASNFIGLIVPSAQQFFFAGVVEHIERICFQRGYKLLLCVTNLDEAKERECYSMLMSNKVAGVIQCNQTPRVEEYIQPDAHVVIMERVSSKSIPSVVADNYNGGRIAAEHLIEKGCRHLMFIDAPLELEADGNRRGRGFKDAADRQGIECIREEIPIQKYRYGDVDDSVREFFERHPETDGITSSETIAAAAVRYCLRNGKRVPEDVKVVGYDDTLFASSCEIPLTVIHQPVEEMCAYAVDAIIRQAAGEIIPVRTVLPVKLVERSST